MLVSATIKPNAKQANVRKHGNAYVISVKSPAKEGKANKEVIELLAECLNLSKSRLSLHKGLRSKHKIIKIL